MATAQLSSAAVPSATPVAPVRRRVDSVDLLRGIIMILMALDHTRDFFGNAAVSPTDMATTTAPLFLTRWVTHFCAPVFFLLTGTGAWLARGRRSTGNLSRFLLTRGLWLVVLELTVSRFFWQFNVDYQVTFLTTLWALGWSMVALAALVHLPAHVTGGIGAVMIVVHNAFDGVKPESFGTLAPLWTILHQPGVLHAAPGRFVFDAYPLIPWIGVMAVGYAIGPLYALDATRRRAILLRAGLAMTAGFVVLRAVNVYGDAARWSVQPTPLHTLLSFLNTTKYPPSLLFLLMTLGPALLLLRAVDGGTPAPLRRALVFGRVPMFYFLLHILVLHLFAMAASLARYGAVHWMWESARPDQFPVTQPPGWPAPLPAVYLVWLATVLVLYPLCRWYGELKGRRTDAWLSYL